MTGKKAGLVWLWRDSGFTGARLPMNLAGVLRQVNRESDEHLQVWIAVNVALRRCGKGEGRESPDLQPSIPWGFLAAHLGVGFDLGTGQE